MIKTLKKVGNSNAVILDKALMELVGLKENDALQVNIHDGSIILTPVQPNPIDDEHFDVCLNAIVNKRRTVLKRLAK